MDEIKKLVSKGMRISKTRRLNIPIRAEMADWLKELAFATNSSSGVIARGFLEDCFDRYMQSAAAAAPTDPEVQHEV